MIAYLTDVEGRWDKFLSFTTGNSCVSFVDGALELAEGARFVFGGDAIDRGPHARRLVSVLLAAKRKYGERVVLLAGNRDINKTRLVTELNGRPHRRAPAGGFATRGELLRWTFAETMGAAKAFEHRATELRECGSAFDDEAVVESYLADLAPSGPLRSYLSACTIAFRAGATLFVHGGITAENFLQLPDGAAARDVEDWVARLDQFYRSEMEVFAGGTRPDALIAYQSQGPDKLNQRSVVYARPADANGNPQLPSRDVVDALMANGVRRVVVGHTPSGDCPAILRDGEFELVLADNSYGRIESGSQVVLTDETTSVRGQTMLDGVATPTAVQFTLGRGDTSPIGLRDAKTGQLVKARLASGDVLLFRGLPAFRVEQLHATEGDLGGRTLQPPR